MHVGPCVFFGDLDFFSNRVKAKLGLAMFFLANPQLTLVSLLIGDDAVSLLKGDNASYFSIDNDVLFLFMDNNASYFSTSDNTLSLSMGNNASYFSAATQ